MVLCSVALHTWPRQTHSADKWRERLAAQIEAKENLKLTKSWNLESGQSSGHESASQPRLFRYVLLRYWISGVFSILVLNRRTNLKNINVQDCEQLGWKNKQSIKYICRSSCRLSESRSASLDLQRATRVYTRQRETNWNVSAATRITDPPACDTFNKN